MSELVKSRPRGGEVTATTMAALAERLPSLTVTVMVTLLVVLPMVVKLSDRFSFAPPNTMLAFGMMLVLEEVAVTVRLRVEVSISPTVKGMSRRDSPTLTFVEASKPVIVGASFTGFAAGERC